MLLGSPPCLRPRGDDASARCARRHPALHLILAARAARAGLARGGRSLSRDALADAMREHGTGVSNERASLLLMILKAEERFTPIGLAVTSTVGSEADDRPHVAA